jgi:hypothetical protein
MSGFPILDLVVGIIFIYFLLSIISSSALEIVLTAFKLRAKMLESWLKTIFDKPYPQPGEKKTTLGKVIMDHCSVTALSGEDAAPSYIDAKNFASALLERISFDPANPQKVPANLDEYIAAIAKTTTLSTELQRVFLTYAVEAKQTYQVLTVKTGSDIDLFRQKVENWFDTSMERVSGKLKSTYSRPITFVIAILTAVLLNADSIVVAKYLYNNPEARTALAAKAYMAGDTSKTRKQIQVKGITTPGSQKVTDSLIKVVNGKIADIAKAKAALNDSIPLGWGTGEWRFQNQGKFSWRLFFTKLIGLFGTVLAIMMGAPFWFDLLNKISNLRGSGTKPAPTDKVQDNK